MDTAKLQKLYTPLLDVRSDGGSLVADIFQNALAHGPVYELVVHDTPSWRELAHSNELVGGMIRLVPEDEVRTYEKNAEKFMAPLVEQIGGAVNPRGERVPPIEVYRPMRTVLVQMQIGAVHRASVAVDHLQAASDQIGTLRSQKDELSNADEVFARLDALDHVIRAYNPIEVDGMRYVPEGPSLDERVKALQEDIFQAASEGKLLLGDTGEPIGSRLDRAAKGVRAVLESKWGQRVHKATDVFTLFTGGAGALAIGAASIIAGTIPGLRYDRFAPPVVDDWQFAFVGGSGAAVGSTRYGWESSVYVETSAPRKRSS